MAKHPINGLPPNGNGKLQQVHRQQQQLQQLQRPRAPVRPPVRGANETVQGRALRYYQKARTGKTLPARPQSPPRRARRDSSSDREESPDSRGMPGRRFLKFGATQNEEEAASTTQQSPQPQEESSSSTASPSGNLNVNMRYLQNDSNHGLSRPPQPISAAVNAEAAKVAAVKNVWLQKAIQIEQNELQSIHIKMMAESALPEAEKAWRHTVRKGVNERFNNKFLECFKINRIMYSTNCPFTNEPVYLVDWAVTDVYLNMQCKAKIDDYKKHKNDPIKKGHADWERLGIALNWLRTTPPVWDIDPEGCDIEAIVGERPNQAGQPIYQARWWPNWVTKKYIEHNITFETYREARDNFEASKAKGKPSELRARFELELDYALNKKSANPLDSTEAPFWIPVQDVVWPPMPNKQPQSTSSTHASATVNLNSNNKTSEWQLVPNSNSMMMNGINMGPSTSKQAVSLPVVSKADQAVKKSKSHKESSKKPRLDKKSSSKSRKESSSKSKSRKESSSKSKMPKVCSSKSSQSSSSGKERQRVPSTVTTKNGIKTKITYFPPHMTPSTSTSSSQMVIVEEQEVDNDELEQLMSPYRPDVHNNAFRAHSPSSADESDDNEVPTTSRFMNLSDLIPGQLGDGRMRQQMSINEQQAEQNASIQNNLNQVEESTEEEEGADENDAHEEEEAEDQEDEKDDGDSGNGEDAADEEMEEGEAAAANIIVNNNIINNNINNNNHYIDFQYDAHQAIPNPQQALMREDDPGSEVEQDINDAFFRFPSYRTWSNF